MARNPEGSRGEGDPSGPDRPRSNGPTEGRRDPLEFFAAFGSLVDEFAAGIAAELEAAGERERLAVANVLRATLTAQTRGLAGLFREVLQGLPAEGVQAVVRFLAATGAHETIASAREALQNRELARRSVLEWIKFILELIKKIIAQLISFLRRFFPLAFGLIRTLLMILAILNILDNILDALNRMLTAKEPVRMEELTRSMWQGLETYWRAEAALMDFRPATASGAPESM